MTRPRSCQSPADEVGNPDEPYRYVKPPASAKTTKPPTTARAVTGVRNGTNAPQFANSGESGPQVSIYFPSGAVKVPPGATGVTITATPMAPAPPLPTDGTIVSNVYRLAATAAGQQLPLSTVTKQQPSLQMRAPSSQQPGPVFEHRTASGWQRFRTIRVGNDVYQVSPVPALGDWALVQLGKASQPASKGGVNIALLVGGLALLALAIVIFVIRSRRLRPAS